MDKNVDEGIVRSQEKGPMAEEGRPFEINPMVLIRGGPQEIILEKKSTIETGRKKEPSVEGESADMPADGMLHLSGQLEHWRAGERPGHDLESDPKNDLGNESFLQSSLPSVLP